MLAQIKEKNGVCIAESTPQKTKHIPKSKKELQETLAQKTAGQKKIDAETFENAQVTEKKTNASVWFAQSFPLKLKVRLCQHIFRKINRIFYKQSSSYQKAMIFSKRWNHYFPEK